MPQRPPALSRPHIAHSSRKVTRVALQLTQTESGELTIPLAAYRQIEHKIPRSILQPDFDGITSANSSLREIHQQDATYIIIRGETVRMFCRDVFWVRDLLDKAGYAVTLDRPKVPAEILIPDFTALENRQKDPEFNASVLVRHPFSQIEVGCPEEAWKQTLEILRCFPNAPFLLPFARRSEAEAFHRFARRDLGESIQLLQRMTDQLQTRVVLTTYNNFGDLGFVDYPAAIFPGWPGSLHAHLRMRARSPHWQRLHLFQTPADRFSQADEAELRFLFGPVVRLNRRPKAEPHQLHLINFGGDGKTQKPPRSENRSKQRLYWEHNRRNRFIAALAREVAAQSDLQRLKCVVLTENTAHAENVASHLSTWTLMALTSAENAPAADRLIVTLQALQKHPELRPAYVINAMGGAPSAVFADWMAQQTAAGHVVRIIDFTDGFNHHAAEVSRQRQQALTGPSSLAVRRPLRNEILKSARTVLRETGRAVHD